MTRFIITGGGGYIGGHLALRLVKEGHEVKVIDKLPLEDAFRLVPVIDNKRFSYCQLEISDTVDLVPMFRGFDAVFHFAASADITLGFQQTDLDIKQGSMLTYKVLETMRQAGVKDIIFSSTGTVYGYPAKVPTPEDSGTFLPISLYGASKLASEGLISAFCHCYGLDGWIFRFGNIIGKDSQRGVIWDLIEKLKKNSSELEVLGDGEQLKDYVYIDDCLDAMLYGYSKSKEKVNVFNIGSDSNLSVKQVVKIILEDAKLNDVKVRYSGGPAGWRGGGWPGDVNLVLYDIARLKVFGWKPRFSSYAAVKQAVKETLENVGPVSH